jgi:hypothetical protein
MHHADPGAQGAQRARAHLPGVDAEHVDPAAGRAERRAEDADQRRLARPDGPTTAARAPEASESETWCRARWPFG